MAEAALGTGAQGDINNPAQSHEDWTASQAQSPVEPARLQPLPPLALSDITDSGSFTTEGL